MTNFEKWWYNVGSGIRPEKGEDMEAFAHRLSKLAVYNVIKTDVPTVDTIKRGDIVKLVYRQCDLEDEDLGMSGYVLSSPLKKFGLRLNERFFVVGTIKELNDVYVLQLESGQNDRDYIVDLQYIRKA